MGVPFLLPSINDLNSGDTSTNVTTDTTLNTDAAPDDNGGSSFADVLNNLIATAPSIYLLSRTPQNKLPVIAGGTPQQPKVIPATGINNLSSSNLLVMFIILIIAIIFMAMIFRKG